MKQTNLISLAKKYFTKQDFLLFYNAYCKNNLENQNFENLDQDGIEQVLDPILSSQISALLFYFSSLNLHPLQNRFFENIFFQLLRLHLFQYLAIYPLEELSSLFDFYHQKLRAFRKKSYIQSTSGPILFSHNQVPK